MILNENIPETTKQYYLHGKIKFKTLKIYITFFKNHSTPIYPIRHFSEFFLPGKTVGPYTIG